jgi:hypothetical protein
MPKDPKLVIRDVTEGKDIIKRFKSVLLILFIDSLIQKTRKFEHSETTGHEYYI